MIGLPVLDVSSPLSYVIALVIPALDVILPVLPGETAVIALGVASAGHADPRIAVLAALAAAGAFAGDNLAYLLGRRFAPQIQRWVFAGRRGARRRAWAGNALEKYGARIIVACRFLPGGRTAVTVTCGVIGYPRRRFAAATACAAAIWASYAFFLGRLGGRSFEDRLWLGLLLALGAALLLSILTEILRRTRPWRVIRRHGPRGSALLHRHRRVAAGVAQPAHRRHRIAHPRRSWPRPGEHSQVATGHRTAPIAVGSSSRI